MVFGTSTKFLSQATSFNQNLCNWSAGMRTGTAPTVTDMFANSGCPRTGNPNTSLDPVSPLCHTCQVIGSRTELDTAIDNWMSTSDTRYGATINDWDVSQVDDFYRLFWLKSTFNDDIGSWQTSHVTTMQEMFSEVSWFLHYHFVCTRPMMLI